MSKAKVHESIAWVESFPTNIAVAAFGDGKKLRDLDDEVIKTLDNSRYIFLRTYDGLAGCFFNDNHTLDIPTSDYAYINDVRTMDKAVRGVRTYLLPKLGRPMLSCTFALLTAPSASPSADTLALAALAASR